ncbi:MAG: flavodoxin domain-containing protein [Chloroflexi bacterium]|nr:flavodoxin domain-containing protein [Chloroflexota bacterium]
MKLLLAYASRKGSTRDTIEKMGERLTDKGFEITVTDCDEVHDVSDYDGIIIGSGIYKGMWLPAAETFLRRFSEALGTTPLAAFILCIRILEPDGREHVMTEYMPMHLLEKLNVISLEAFAGQLIASEIEWHERWTLTIRYDGAVDPNQTFDEDYRRWDKIYAWVDEIAEKFREA